MSCGNALGILTDTGIPPPP